MTRPMLSVSITDESGNDVEDAVVTFYETDAVTPLAQSLYAAPSGGSAEVAHVTDALGELVRFAPIPQRFRYKVNGGTAKWGQFDPDPADVILDHDTRSRILDGTTGTDPVLTLRPGNASGVPLRIANSDDDTVVTVTRSGGNDVVIVGDDDTTPTTALLYVTKAITASDSVAQRVKGAIGTLSLTGVGALEVLLENNVASSTAKAHAGLIVTSSGAQTSTEGILIHGTGGHQDLIKGYAADNTTVLWRVSGTSGAVTSGANASTSGQIRLPNTAPISARNAANTANLDLIYANAANNVIVGATTGVGTANLIGSTGATLQVAANTELNAHANGVIVGRTTGLLGFYGASGAAKASAYTQTAYATADRTHAAPTATAVTNAFGTADGTYQDTTATSAAIANNFQETATRINQLIADIADTKQLCNAIIDDLQAVGLVG